MNLNKVFIIGRITADPELRTTPSGDHVASFSIATNRYWRTKEGERKESTEFHNIVAWGRQAEVINQFSKKGSVIMIEGRLQTRAWEGKDGQTRRTTEIVAENIQLGPRAGDVGASFVKDESSVGGEQQKHVKDIPVIDLDESGAASEGINPEDLPF